MPDWLGLGWGWGRGRFSCASGRRICPPRGVGGGSGVGGRFGAAAVMVLTAIGSDAIYYAGVAPKEARRSPVAGWPSLWLLGGVPKTLGWLPKRPGGHPWRGGRRYGCWEGSREPWGGSQRGPAVTPWRGRCRHGLPGGDPRTPTPAPAGPGQGAGVAGRCGRYCGGIPQVLWFGCYALLAVLLGIRCL